MKSAYWKIDVLYGRMKKYLASYRQFWDNFFPDFPLEWTIPDAVNSEEPYAEMDELLRIIHSAEEKEKSKPHPEYHEDFVVPVLQV